MAMKHRITINVTDPNGKKAAVLRGADMKLPCKAREVPLRGLPTGLPPLTGADSRIREHQ